MSKKRSRNTDKDTVAVTGALGTRRNQTRDWCDLMQQLDQVATEIHQLPDSPQKDAVLGWWEAWDESPVYGKWHAVATATLAEVRDDGRNDPLSGSFDRCWVVTLTDVEAMP